MRLIPVMGIARHLFRWLAVCFPAAGLVTFLFAFGPLYSLLQLPKEWEGALGGPFWGVVLLTPLFAWIVLASLKRKEVSLYARQILTSLQWGFVFCYPALALLALVVIFTSKR